MLAQRDPKVVRVVRLVSEQTQRLYSCYELLGRLAVVALPFGNLEGERKAQRVDNKVDFRRQAPTRTPYPLRDRPPLPPAAC